ncbi:hypothetical protein GGI59_000143 [Rhizobium lentis]|uniref:Uncharacterized protein n=1 Tax=Rhizobium lentis TaxID=1138194 RepID=A0A7W8XCJ1_9HYPH|nr:hypothetical protein [Rhizobium lentis]MBB5547989.1 hypothetical protein [Rhizobium lentis]MBB5558516.1 hypothetical protein [Rhizobium lentis]MBB5565960.1 hypothetical protein [Rhizobium lentis]
MLNPATLRMVRRERPLCLNAEISSDAAATYSAGMYEAALLPLSNRLRNCAIFFSTQK